MKQGPPQLPRVLGAGGPSYLCSAGHQHADDKDINKGENLRPQSHGGQEKDEDVKAFALEALRRLDGKE